MYFWSYISTYSIFQTAATGKLPSTTPTVPDVIKKRVERFGDTSQVAKTNTINVWMRMFLLFEYKVFYILGTKTETYGTI